MPRLPRKLAAAAALIGLAIPIGWAMGPTRAEGSPTIASAGDATPGDDGTGDAEAGTLLVDSAPPVDGDRQTRRDGRRDERQAVVAARLGMTPEQLREARLRVLADHLGNSVEHGWITPDRAAEILDAARAGRLDDLRRDSQVRPRLD
ncbi:MAG: hypothetical protein U0Q22_09855 [Acidimicrobiales bacterium]